MQRKRFLKKVCGMILCVGVFLSMSVTANAADKGKIVGDWTGGWASVSFYDDGMAKDQWNTRSYHIESGSLTATNHVTNKEETVKYDLWRGEQIENVPTDQKADAVLYVIIEPGKKMSAVNVVKTQGSDKWEIMGLATITKVEKVDTGSKPISDNIDFADLPTTDFVSSARKCEHNYEWITTMEPTETEDGEICYMCIACGNIEVCQPISANVVIRRNLLTSIKNAEAGTTVTFDNKAWLCYPKYVLDALKEKGDISLKTDFAYEGKNYSFIIPAGSDYANLEQADFYGFMYLFGVFNGIIVE